MKTRNLIGALLLAVTGWSQADSVTNFFADLNSCENGAATSDNLKAGTQIGGWKAVTPKDSYVTNGALYCGAGQYFYQIWPSFAVKLANNPKVHIEMLAATDKSIVNWNIIRLRDENDAGLIQLRFNAWSSVQQWNGTAWTMIATSKKCGSAIQGRPMNTLDIILERVVTR